MKKSVKQLDKENIQDFNEWTNSVKINKKGKLMLQQIDIKLSSDISGVERHQLILEKKIIAEDNKHGTLYYILIILLCLTLVGAILTPMLD